MTEPTWSEVFGPVVTTETVASAVQKLLEEWLPTYVAVVASASGLPVTVQAPQSYQSAFDFENYKQFPLPACIVVCPGFVGFERQAEGEVGAWAVIEAGVLVKEQEEGSARRISALYSSAIALLLEQRGSLASKDVPGLSDQTLVEKIDAVLPLKGSRDVACGQVKAKAFVHGIMDKLAGPPSGVSPESFGPYPNPTEEYPPLHKANTVVITVDGKKLDEDV